MKITVVQPSYLSGNESITSFILQELQKVEVGSLTVFPEYSNAAGISDKDEIFSVMPMSEKILAAAAKSAKEKQAYIAINVLQKRGEKIMNSTYLFGKDGNVAFVYDKIHLPPFEVTSLGIEHGNGNCFCMLDGIRFAFMTCYDVYFNEQLECIAGYKPDVILVPGYQRGERTDIIRAQTKLTAFRCNAFVARSSYSMSDDERGGCSMIVSPDGQILGDLGKEVGTLSFDVDIFSKYMRTAGFGGSMIRNDDFISNGLRPEVFSKS